MRKLLFFIALAASPAFAQEPSSQPAGNKVYGIYVDGKGSKDMLALGIIFGFPSIVAGIALALRHRAKMKREQTLQIALQQGEKVAPEIMAVLTEDRSKSTDSRSMPSAVFLGCLLAGIGFIPALHQYGVMMFFFCMGAGFVLRAYFNQKK